MKLTTISTKETTCIETAAITFENFNADKVLINALRNTESYFNAMYNVRRGLETNHIALVTLFGAFHAAHDILQGLHPTLKSMEMHIMNGQKEYEDVYVEVHPNREIEYDTASMDHMLIANSVAIQVSHKFMIALSKEFNAFDYNTALPSVNKLMNADNNAFFDFVSELIHKYFIPVA